MDDGAITLLVSAEQLDRYFANELPLPEAKRIRTWLMTNPEIAKRAHAMRNLWTPVDWAAPDITHGWETVAAQISSFHDPDNLHDDDRLGVTHITSSTIRTSFESRRSVEKVHSLQRQGAMMQWTRHGFVALVVLCICLAGGWATWEWWRTSDTSTSNAQWKMYRTVRGQHAELRLADGTKVTLAPDSRLQVRQDGPFADREVELNGQAYFVVIPHPSRPFLVRTQYGITKELGTSFSVSSYPGDSATRVVVSNGRVAMWASNSLEDRHARSVQVVEAGEVAIITRTGVSEFAEKADLARELRWVDRELVFHLTPLDVIMTTLERWYDVHVTYEDPSVKNLLLTVTVTDDPIDQTLRVITRTLNLRFERRGNAVRILGTYH